MITHLHAQRRGVALVLVLAFLVLISVFVIGFFVSATSELSASTGYAASVTTQQLSETATNIVAGQIREATTRPGEVWASQPGMVRTYRTKTPQSFYKLYSSNKMVVEGAGVNGEASATGFKPMDGEVPVGSQGWNHKPAVYVDLNDPVRVPLPGSDKGVSGALNVDYEYRYPIVDPTSFYLRTSETDPNIGNFLPATPSAAAPGEKRVEGAELIKVAGDDSGNGPNGTDKKTVYTRMPVRWLYILKDGTATAPDHDTNGTLAQWTDDGSNPAAIPSTTNPIVGRIAFWTDDDSCKVNINTAGGFNTLQTTSSGKNEDMYPGSYWDSPRFFTLFDRGDIDDVTGNVTPRNMSLSLSQPARNEFQRFAGHPATTSLGLVFKNLLTSTQIYQLTPRLNGGGSLGGTRRLVQALGGDNKKVDIKHERLYASVDELLFAAPKASDTLGQARRLNSSEMTVSAFTPELVNRMRLFLTAHSRAPELNVFGRPRVSIWPLWPIYTASSALYNKGDGYNAKGGSIPTNRNTFRGLVNDNPTEKLIAFCSVLGPRTNDNAVRPYFFQRSNPYSATEDASIPRNQKLFKYLTDLMGQPILGSAGATVSDPATFQTKYPGESDPYGSGAVSGDYRQIISEIFDYVRCVNLNDSSHDTPAPGNQTVVPGQAGYVGGTDATQYKYARHGYVVPSVVPGPLNSSPGFGRFPTVTEAVLVFYHAGYLVWEENTTVTPHIYEAQPIPAALTGPGNGRKYFYDRYARNGLNYNLDSHGKPIPNEHYMGSFMRAFVIFEGFTPMQGYTAESDFDLSSEVRTRGLFFQHQCDGLQHYTVSTDHMINTMSGRPPTESSEGNLNMPPTPFNKYTVNRFYRAPIFTNPNVGCLGGPEGFLNTMFYGSLANPPLTPRAIDAIGSETYYPFQSAPLFSWPTNDHTSTGYMLTTDTPPKKVYIPNALRGPTGSFPGIFIPKEDKMFTFTGGTQGKLTISFSGSADGGANVTGTRVVNTLDLKFPDSGVNGWPVPTDNVWDVTNGGMWHEGAAGTNVAPMNGSDGRVSDLYTGNQADTFTLGRRIWWARQNSFNPWSKDLGGDDHNYGSRYQQILQPGDTIRSLIPFNPGMKVPDPNGGGAGDHSGEGDPRVLALIGNASSVNGAYMQPHPYYKSTRRHAQGLRMESAEPYFGGATGRRARDYDEFNLKTAEDSHPAGEEGNHWMETHFGNMLQDQFNGNQPIQYQNGAVTSDLPPIVKKLIKSDGLAPDFDTGLALSPDGGYLNKSDEGSTSWRHYDTVLKRWVYDLPYYISNREAGYDTYFSPNRQMPSAVQFGSLLSGRTKHWNTLCFCPNPAASAHAGLTKDPKDHFLLDLFTMPVVEPYAISEPFSTAGKVNLNYAMAPFGYIRRSTAMRAVLHSVRIPAIPTADSKLYKQTSAVTQLLQTENLRFRVNRDETLKAFDSLFMGKTTGNQDIFRTGSQLCEMYLYPNMYSTESVTGPAKPELAKIGVDPKFSPDGAAMKHFWEHCPLTGDNLREKPYNDIYPRITTKSNTFTVHMWVQALKKSSTAGLAKSDAAAAVKSWNENKDQVAAEYRGSTTIERYIDPEDRHFDPSNAETMAKGDYIDPDLKSLESLYRFRVVETKRFAP